MPCQCVDAALGCRIGPAAKPADQRVGRTDIHDRRLRAEHLERLTAHTERRAQHEIEEVVERFVIGLVHRLGTAYAGIVDEVIQPAKLLDGETDGLLGTILGGHVDGERRERGREPRAFLFHLRELVRIAAYTDYGNSRFQECACRCQSDAAGRSGNQCDTHGHPPKLVRLKRRHRRRKVKDCRTGAKLAQDMRLLQVAMCARLGRKTDTAMNLDAKPRIGKR